MPDRDFFTGNGEEYMRATILLTFYVSYRTISYFKPRIKEDQLTLAQISLNFEFLRIEAIVIIINSKFFVTLRYVIHLLEGTSSFFYNLYDTVVSKLTVNLTVK